MTAEFFKNALFIIVLCYSLPCFAEFNDSTLLQKAEAGDVCMQGKAAYNYYHGQGGVNTDKLKAAEWYRRAAEIKCKDFNCGMCQSDAQKVLGMMYELGEGLPKNDAEAFKWYKLASEANPMQTAGKLAEFYALGRGVKQDYKESYFWALLDQPPNVTFVGRPSLRDEIKNKHISAKEAKQIEDNFQERAKEIQKQAIENYKQLLPGVGNVSPENTEITQRLWQESLAYNYDIDGINALIKAGAVVNGGRDGTLLIEVAKKGRLDIVKSLVAAGADINATDNRGFTALGRSINHHHKDIALFLIQSGARTDLRNDLSNAPLMDAAQEGDIDIVNALIAAGANVNAGVDSYGWHDALTYAIQGNHKEIIDILLKAGAVKREEHERLLAIVCPADTQTCPGGSVVSRIPTWCNFAPCPVQPAPIPVEKKMIEGTYSEIDTKISTEAARLLGDDAQKERITAEIKAHPENYNPPTLAALGEMLFRQYKDDEAAFWYFAAHARGRGDALICSPNDPWEPTRYMGFGSQQPHEYLKNHPEKIKELIAKLVDWDKKTPRNYDRRWVQLKQDNRDKPLPKEPLCLPVSRWASFEEAGRRTYLEELERASNQLKAAEEGKPLFDIPKAKNYQKKAENGDKEAQYNLARAYEYGGEGNLSMEQRALEVQKWLTKSAEQNYEPAMIRLGELYMAGFDHVFGGTNILGGDKDTQKGRELMIKAGAQNPVAYFHLGQSYSYTPDNDNVEAYAWFKLAESYDKDIAFQPRVYLEAKMSEQEIAKGEQLAQQYHAQYFKNKD